jgi:4-carboxymuconolactone decarboxylase
LSRIPLVVKREDMPAAQQHFFDRIVRTRGRVARPYQVLLNSPAVADRVASVGEFLLYDTVLRPAVKTLTWLIAAREYDCDYEWAACVGHARKAGVQDALIDAIWNRKRLAGLTQEQETLVDFCHQLLRGNHRVNPASYRAAVEHFGVAATVQIAATIGYFVMMAFVLNAFEVDPKAEEPEPSL